jgi:hypothetical protein
MIKHGQLQLLWKAIDHLERHRTGDVYARAMVLRGLAQSDWTPPMRFDADTAAHMKHLARWANDVDNQDGVLTELERRLSAYLQQLG